VIAYLVGIALPFPGFVGTLGPTVSPAAQNLGHLGWLLSFVSSFVVYYVICLVWPTRNQKIIKEMGLGWEEMGNREVVAADGTIITDEQEGRPDTSLGVYGTEKVSGTFTGERKFANDF
jgi:nucleobase:cation symporter-1, NCS1 family